MTDHDEGGSLAMALERPEIDFPEGAPPSYLDITDITVGDGPEAVKGSNVTVHYVGVAYSTGEEFDASWNRGEPFSFELGAGKVIPGWDRGLVGAKVGSRIQLDIPTKLAYGENPRPGSPAGPLRFIVDVLSIK